VKMKNPEIIPNSDPLLDAIDRRLAQVEDRFKPKVHIVRPFNVGDRVCSVRDTEASYMGLVERDGVVLVKFPDQEFPTPVMIQGVERPVERQDKRLMRTSFPESEPTYQTARDLQKSRPTIS
jgi:hypothetical protein